MANGDTIVIQALDSLFAANLTVNAGAGDDEITINAFSGAGNYTINGNTNDDTLNVVGTVGSGTVAFNGGAGAGDVLTITRNDALSLKS